MALVTIPQFDTVYAVEEAGICNKALARIGAEPIRDTVEDTKQSRLCRSVYGQTRDELIRMYPFNFSTKTAYIPRDTAFSFPMNQYSYAFNAEDHITCACANSSTVVLTGVSGVTNFLTMIGRKVYGTGLTADTRIVDADPALFTITLDREPSAAITSFTAYLPILKILEVAANAETLFDVIRGGADRRILCNMISGVENFQDVLELKYSEQVVDPAKFDSMFTDALVLRIASKIAVPLSNSPQLAQVLQQEFAAIMQVAKNATAEEKQLDSPDAWWTDRIGTEGVSQARR